MRHLGATHPRPEKGPQASPAPSVVLDKPVAGVGKPTLPPTGPSPRAALGRAWAWLHTSLWGAALVPLARVSDTLWGCE